MNRAAVILGLVLPKGLSYHCILAGVCYKKAEYGQPLSSTPWGVLHLMRFSPF